MLGSALRRGPGSGYAREDLSSPAEQQGDSSADRAEGARARSVNVNGVVVVADDDASPPLPVSTTLKGGGEDAGARRSSKPTGFLILAAGCASMNSILLGYDIGAT